MLRYPALPRSAILLFLISAIVLSPAASAAGSTITTSGEFVLFLPIILAFIITLMLWKLLLPTSLSSLQVAFEVDDGLYEVHRLTKTRADSKDLLSLPRVGLGVTAYLMAMAGILILIAELLIIPSTFHTASVVLMVILIALPVLYSPLETLAAQLSKKSSVQEVGGSWLMRFIKRFILLILLFMVTLAILLYGWNTHPDDRATWVVYAALVFMSPTILAYGRILGASWNMLLVNKWRSYKGQQTPVNPDEPGRLARLNSLVLVVFLVTMPITAMNGIFTVLYVALGDASPDTMENILNYGGLLGWGITEGIHMQELIDRFQWLKGLPFVLATFLTMNIAIVGLAFIFELIRNLFIGGQTFSGVGGVTLATPHEIRAEKTVQARLLYFSFAGFSGYTVLLLVLVCYKEFSSLMPYAAELEGQGFSESVILMATWSFIAVGQGVFLVTWLLSMPRLKVLRELEFDLSPEERRGEIIDSGAGDWMKNLIHEAARREDINGLRLFQSESLAGDQAVVRMEKTRARMIERAMRGLWPQAMSESRSLLAQQGGEGLEARLILAISYIATRRLDAAKQILYGIDEEERDDDTEVLMMMTEFLDPWRGEVDLDLRKKHIKNPTVVHLGLLMKRLAVWEAGDSGKDTEAEIMDLRSRLSAIAMLRLQRRGIEALELAIGAVKDNHHHVGARIALALCLLDGIAMPEDRFSALDLYRGLARDAQADPRVHALGVIIGEDASLNDLETALVLSSSEMSGSGKSKKKSESAKVVGDSVSDDLEWMDEAPVNPVAALCSGGGGNDEALAANLLIIGHQAMDRGLPPTLRRTNREYLIHYYILMPLWAVLGIGLGFAIDKITIGVAMGLLSILGHIMILRMQRSQEKNITHRDQMAMVNLAKRMRRNKVNFDASALPVGTHLLLSGMLISVQGVTYDIGLPGWMVENIPATKQKDFIEHMAERRREYRTAKPARSRILEKKWWQKRERMSDSEGALARLLGADVASAICPSEAKPSPAGSGGKGGGGGKGDLGSSGKGRRVVRRKGSGEGGKRRAVRRKRK